jgi:hypothetical protein
MMMSGTVEHIGKPVLISQGDVRVVGYLMMPSLQQIVGMIAILLIPFVMVGGYFFSEFFPQKKS